MAKFSPPPGTADIFPEEMPLWIPIEAAARKIFPLYGYGELRTPIFEYTEVFKRGLGDETEVVRKEMYSFEDRGGRSLTLRPEGTAGVMRALAGTDVMNGNERRIYYLGPMFRGERPAAGRRRQFHQVGTENVGRVAPGLDAECIAMLMRYLAELGIVDAKLLINTRGVAADREPAAEGLRQHLTGQIDTMCDDCKERFRSNIWRILDCKNPDCRTIVDKLPSPSTWFSEETMAYFNQVLAILDDLGIKYEVDSKLVRGLDYYVHTVFEVTHDALGAQNAIAGGGRYEVFPPESKKPLVGVGFAAGLERLLMVRDALNVDHQAAVAPTVFIAGLGSEAVKFNQKLAAELRAAGIATIVEVEAKSMKAQMRAANRLGVRFALVRGEDEIAKGEVSCKDMAEGEETHIPIAEVVDTLKSRLD